MRVLSASRRRIERDVVRSSAIGCLLAAAALALARRARSRARPSSRSRPSKSPARRSTITACSRSIRRPGSAISPTRTTTAVVVFDTKTDKFVTRIGGFVGQTKSGNASGPNGLVVVNGGAQLWVSDGDSTIKVVDLKTHTIVSTFATGGKLRANGMAFDPSTRIVIVANSNDDAAVPQPDLDRARPQDRGQAAGAAVGGEPGALGLSCAERHVLHRDPGARSADKSKGILAQTDPKNGTIVKLHELDRCHPHSLSIVSDTTIFLGCSTAHGPNRKPGGDMAIFDIAQRPDRGLSRRPRRQWRLDRQSGKRGLYYHATTNGALVVVDTKTRRARAEGADLARLALARRQSRDRQGLCRDHRQGRPLRRLHRGVRVRRDVHDQGAIGQRDRASVHVLALIGRAIAPSPAAAQGVWATKAPMPGGPRENTGVVAFDGRMYVVGGNAFKDTQITRTEVYDPATDSWSARAPMPSGSHHIAATLLNGKIYTFGGFTGQAHVAPVDNAFEYDPKADRWRAIAKLTSPRGSPSAVALNGKIHLLGGRGADNKTIGNHEVLRSHDRAVEHARPVCEGARPSGRRRHRRQDSRDRRPAGELREQRGVPRNLRSRHQCVDRGAADADGAVERGRGRIPRHDPGDGRRGRSSRAPAARSAPMRATISRPANGSRSRRCRSASTGSAPPCSAARSTFPAVRAPAAARGHRRTCDVHAAVAGSRPSAC